MTAGWYDSKRYREAVGAMAPDRVYFGTIESIYKFYYMYGYHLGHATEKPKLKAKFVEDKNGHILPYVHFEGGRMAIGNEALKILREAAR
jgi:hypothetical protein